MIHEPFHTKTCRITQSYSREDLVMLRKRGLRLSVACDCASVERAQRDDEAWMHAACLSIAEGVPDWDKPTPYDSLAMIAVRDLRRVHEEELEANEELHRQVNSLFAQIEQHAAEKATLIDTINVIRGTAAAKVPAVKSPPALTMTELRERYWHVRGLCHFSVHRVWPKVFPGGRRADGFIELLPLEVDESYIHKAYGGGEYLIRAVEMRGGVSKQMEMVRVHIAGEPNFGRPANGVGVFVDGYKHEGTTYERAE